MDATAPDKTAILATDEARAPTSSDAQSLGTASSETEPVWGKSETHFVDTSNLATFHNPHNLSQPETPKKPLSATIVTSVTPDRMTKIIGVDASGNMTKSAAAHMTRGKARRVELADLNALRGCLEGLSSADAVLWGVSRQYETLLCGQTDSEAIAAGAIARTRENFSFPAAPGVLMLDHDGLQDGTLSASEFRARLLLAAPCLATAPMLMRPSASAGCLSPDGSELSGLTRHRAYVPVMDASKIPAAGKALEQLLWAAGDGWFVVGVAGQRLQRCLVDTSVWQPERIDFAGKPILSNGVTRAGIDGAIYGDAAAQFDLQVLIDAADDASKRKAQAAIKASRAEKASQADEVRGKWVAENAPRLAASRGIKVQQASAVLERAAVHQVLMGDFELICQYGQTVTVGQILDNPHKWHNTRFADPLDPDQDRRVAVARLLNGGRPDLFSHRHGGMRYELRRQSARVQLGKGMRIEATDAVLGVIRDRAEIYDFGPSAMAYVAEGAAVPVSRDWLLDHCGRIAEFFSVKTDRDDDGNIIGVREMAEDAPTYIAASILAKNGGRGFRKLSAVTTAPTLRRDGSIFDAPGHDDHTGLVYVTNEPYPPTVPVAPTVQQALDALALLWHPVRLFPFVDDVSRGVTLAAMLSACLRPGLSTCPAFGMDAPSAGTGKTLLAKCIGALATGGDIPVLAPTNDEDECRKRLFAALRGGGKVILWDNVREPLGNATIDSFLTSGLFADRVLGVSENVELPNRALFIVSGNNMVLTGDTHRRVLMARLDADMESPFKREFAFSPLDDVIQHRQKLVVAALTIVRAFIAAGRPKSAPGRTASFEQWDDLVRQPVAWLANLARDAQRTDLPGLADPMDAVDRAQADNPEIAKLTAVLHAWRSSFGDRATTPKQAIDKATAVFDADTQLFDALDEIAGQHGRINIRMLGRWIEKHSQQLCDGYRFNMASKAHGLKHWVVTPSKERAESAKTAQRVVKVAKGCEISDASELAYASSEEF